AILAAFFLLDKTIGANDENFVPGPDYVSFKTEDEANNVEIFSKSAPSVVFVTNTALRRNYVSRNLQEIPQGSGTGFVWDKSGLIVTNFHVIEGASRIAITLRDQ